MKEFIFSLALMFGSLLIFPIGLLFVGPDAQRLSLLSFGDS